MAAFDALPLNAFSEAKAATAASAERSDSEKIGGGSTGALLGESDALRVALADTDADALTDGDALRVALADGDDDVHESALASPQM